MTDVEQNTPKHIKVILSLFGFFAGFILFEFGAYLAIVAGVPLSSHPYYNLAAWSTFYAKFDPEIGFRLNSNKPNSGIRIIGGELQFYYTDIKANKAGFRSNYEYLPKKLSQYRIAVYGDSFTAGMYQNRSWPETLQRKLNMNGVDVEVYNFSFDGGGVYNWHQHYFKVLRNKYDFDLVLFAICCNDLKRGMAIYHGIENDNVIYYRKFHGNAATLAEYKDKFLPHSTPIFEVRPPQQLKKIANVIKKESAPFGDVMSIVPLDFYGSKSMLNISKSIFNEVIFPVIYDIGKPLKNMIFGVEPLKDIFSSKNNKTSPGTIGLIKAKKIENPLEVRKDYSYLLVEMLEDIKRSSKKALILTIPIDKEVLVRNHNPRRNSLGYPKDVITNQNIAQKNCIPHLSGYKIFGHLTEQEYKSFWPSIDGHWLQVGSDEFASRLAPKIKIALTERKLGC